jgi:hypothetical protein
MSAANNDIIRITQTQLDDCIIGREINDIVSEALPIKFYQTAYAKETLAIIEEEDGSVSIGIARASKDDILNRRVTKNGGMGVAEGRAIKARNLKCSLIGKNYLRGLYAKRVEKE